MSYAVLHLAAGVAEPCELDLNWAICRGGRGGEVQCKNNISGALTNRVSYLIHFTNPTFQDGLLNQ